MSLHASLLREMSVSDQPSMEILLPGKARRSSTLKGTPIERSAGKIFENLPLCINLYYSAFCFAVPCPEEKERDDVILPPFGWLDNRTKGEVNENMMELSAIIFFIPHIWYR